jgi:hypothetical protein
VLIKQIAVTFAVTEALESLKVTCLVRRSFTSAPHGVMSATEFVQDG